MAEVRLDGVTKVYAGGVRAVNGITLTVADGELLVLVGPSGCGKTTTLRIVAGLERATGGRVRIDGRAADHLPPRDRNVAIVFQNYALYPHLSVYDNLAFSLRARRRLGALRRPAAWLLSGAYRAQARAERTAIDVRVREAAQTLGLEALLHRRPRQLSGGQRQRVAVGRAIVRQPAVLLLDEPFSNLDAGLRSELRGELRRLHRELRTTTLHVTHDQHEAMTLGQRVAVMHQGTLQQVGAPLEVYGRPVNRFVAGFFGAPSMNFVPGRLALTAGGMTFRRGEVLLPLPPQCAVRLRDSAGREVVLGIRPEDVSPGSDGSDGSDAQLNVAVESVEAPGDRVDVCARLSDGSPLVFRAAARQAPREGDRLGLRLDMAAAHWFEPGELGRNLMLITDRADSHT